MFWKNLIKICNEKNTTPTSVVKDLKIAGGNVTRWKNGSIPRDTTLKKIADYFGITVTDLLAENEKKPVHVDEPKERSLHPEERILLSCYSKISDDDRKVLWTLLDKYLTANEKEYFSQSNPTDNVG